MQSPEHTVGSGEVALCRAVIDQVLPDALATKRIMPDGRPTFASLEGDKARYWIWRAVRVPAVRIVLLSP